MFLSGSELRCQVIDERLFLGVAYRQRPSASSFVDRVQPRGEPLLFNHIGVMA
jgi:hypothetical protein